MKMRLSILIVASCNGLTVNAAAPDGEAIYRQRCAACHDNPQERTPGRVFLSRIPPETIVRALTSGAMTSQATMSISAAHPC